MAVARTTKKLDRPSRPLYWTGIARAASVAATCPRAAVGAVLVIEDHALTTGYNGAPSGFAHCYEEGCILERGADGKEHCKRSIHAEENVILWAARNGNRCAGSTMYVAGRAPCRDCAMRIIQAGIIRVYVQENEGDPVVQVNVHKIIEDWHQ